MEIPLASATIQVHYEKKFIAVAQNFVESMANAVGILPESAKQLVLLVEESLSFIMDKYIDCRFDAHIQLLLKLLPGGTVVIEIVDIGPPIHENNIPKFDIQDASSASGLWHTLVKGIADDFSFVNRYSEGWLISITKNVVMDNAPAPALESPPEATAPPPISLASHRTRMATPEDAATLMDLVFQTYRYSYLADFYNTEKLRDAIARNMCEITVLETDRIIGAYSVSYPDTGERWAEVGGGMILPEYRNGRAILHLFQAVTEYLEKNPRNCDFFVSHLVTTHTRSQKILQKTQNPFVPMFLFLNMVPHLNFISLNNNSERRESTLWCFSLHGPLNLERVYAPKSRHGMLRRLLDNTGYGSGIAIDEAFQEPTPPTTRFNVTRADREGFAILRLECFGADWFAALAGHIIALVGAGIESINVNIPTGTPLPPDMESRLTSIGLLFAGLHLVALDRLDLAYCLITKPVNFDAIQLHSPVARKLQEGMKAEYESRLHPWCTGA